MDWWSGAALLNLVCKEGLQQQPEKLRITKSMRIKILLTVAAPIREPPDNNGPEEPFRSCLRSSRNKSAKEAAEEGKLAPLKPTDVMERTRNTDKFKDFRDVTYDIALQYC